MTEALDDLLAEIRACVRCRGQLPFEPRPVVHAGPTARLLIVGQAPGIRVHRSGRSFDDASGERLRDWLGIDSSVFYDESRVAIMAAALCYPGTGAGGDLPPPKICAPLWHPRLRPLLPRLGLTVLIGGYAQAYYLGDRRGRTVAETVAAWRSFLPDFLPIPHPSPRNRRWLRNHPWFEAEVVPELRRRVAALVTSA